MCLVASLSKLLPKLYLSVCIFVSLCMHECQLLNSLKCMVLCYEVLTGHSYAVVPPPPSATIVVVSPTSIKISWQDDFERSGVNSCTILYERVTAALQQGPCPFIGDNNELTFDSHDMDIEIIITGLEEFSTYTINITTRNAVGYSSPSTLSITTWQAGK